ncbi:DUF7511 domain-containing protein [Natronobiforma cellulositropha]|uniref:DUF7511 domain-containing protein n=1 Tax=Natronobiforma cellulositropha TaxID=1679076 RepID=UPI0021D5FEFB|nr:hypothetical protein [Natronobiforma cellulositropha]
MEKTDITRTFKSELPAASEPTGVGGEFEHVIVMSDDEPAECTIFPRDCTDEEILTTWVSAQSGSFVALETMR